MMDYHNVPESSIQRTLGHTDGRTTEIYLHSLGQAEREAVQVLESVRKKSHTKSRTEMRRFL